MDATDLAFAGAARQADLVTAGEVSPAEVLDATLDRIDRLDPVLNAFRLVLRESAAATAAQGGLSGPLAGVPVAIKDDVAVEGTATCYGTAAEDRAQPADAEVVRRLRAAGAIIVGKTHLPELAHLPATESLAFGASRNPWDLSRTPGGSSGGSAAAVAAGLCGVALGSDGAGSIRGPANHNNLFGLKPSRDRVPLTPHDDGWQGLSVNGPLARTVADAERFLVACADDGAELAGASAADPARLRIAVSFKLAPGVLGPLEAERRAAVLRVAEQLRELGHEVVERDPDLPASLFGSVVGRILRGVADDAADVAHPELLSRRIKALAAMGRRVPIARIRAAEAGQRARVLGLFDDVDVLLTPGAPKPPDPIGAFDGFGASRYLLEGGLRIPYFPTWNLTGQPVAALPAGLDAAGLPMGVQLVGRPRAERTLLALSGQLERAHPWAQARPPL